MKRFSSGVYGRQKLEFFPAPFRAPLRSFAALVFPYFGEKVLLCDIEDRGWCIPSGRVEPNESSRDAALREAHEEAGALLGDLQYLGCYRITDRSDIRWADVFVGRVLELVEMDRSFESRGRQLVEFEAVQEIYHLWTPLTEEVFNLSREVISRFDETIVERRVY